MSNVEKLIERLRTEMKLDIAPDAQFCRTRAGRHQRDAGAWSWFILGTNYGSCYSVAKLLKAEKLSVLDCRNGHFEIFINE